MPPNKNKNNLAANNNGGAFTRQPTPPSGKQMYPSIAINSTRPLYAIDHQAISCGKHISGTKRQIRFRFGFASLDKQTGSPCRNPTEEHDVVLLWSPMISGRAIIHCDGQEVHNVVIRGVSMTVDVSWSIRGNHSLRIVAHATSKMINGHQYELFVNGMSYFNFLTLDQLKLGKTTGQIKRPMKRQTMFESGGGPQHLMEQQQQHSNTTTANRRHSSGGEITTTTTATGRQHQQRYPDYHTPSSLDQSDRSKGSGGGRRMNYSMSNIDEIETSRHSYQSSSDCTPPPLDQSDRSRGGKGGQRRMCKSMSNTIDKSDRSWSDRRRLGKQRSLSNIDESDKSARSRDSHPRPPPQPSSSGNNINHPSMNHNRRCTTDTEQTLKATNVTSSSSSSSSKPKVLQSYKISEKVRYNHEYEYDNDDDDNNSVDTMKRALRTSFVSVARSLSPPTGNVTIVYTDVQGSTLLWEACPSAMKRAQDIHDTILRQCYSDHKGYEITTEGDAFNVAFQHPVDALAFALQAQIKLYKADWPQEILNHPDGQEDPYLKFKGLRVRFGINHGPTTNQIHRVTGRTIYAGEGVKIAKAVEGLCHGGQILCTVETWKAVGGLAERYLGRPQIMDCGEHVLFDAHRTRYSRRIMQLVPNELAFDFFEARGQAEDGTMKDAALVKGRLFPPLPSKKQLTTSFLNAPYTNGRVVICFVYTVGLGDDDDDGNDESENHRGHNLLKLSKNLRKLLLRSDPPGYECQEDNGCWMLAFQKVDQAVMFGLKLIASIREGGAKEHLLGNVVDCDRMYKIGIIILCHQHDTID